MKPGDKIFILGEGLAILLYHEHTLTIGGLPYQFWRVRFMADGYEDSRKLLDIQPHSDLAFMRFTDLNLSPALIKKLQSSEASI